MRHHPSGDVDMAHLRELLEDSSSKTLVSLMHANNEVGVMIDLQAVGQLCKQHDTLFHSDTVQTMGHYPIDLSEVDIDFLACSAHKFHGPKGSGFLYTNPDLRIDGLIVGGGQERAMRGGTENVAGIVGLAKAFELAFVHMVEHESHVRGVKQLLVDGLRARLPEVVFNGNSDQEDRLYTVLNVKFPSHPNSGMATFLFDLEGVACSGGSACSSGATQGSHVLRALGCQDPQRASVRFSFSRYTTTADIDKALEAVDKVFAPVLVEG